MELQPVPCSTCGMTFAVPRHFFEARLADSRALVCPNGCAVRLGGGVPVVERNRELAAKLEEMTVQLRVARQDIDTLVDANLRLADEVECSRRRVVDDLMGPATAEESR